MNNEVKKIIDDLKKEIEEDKLLGCENLKIFSVNEAELLINEIAEQKAKEIEFLEDIFHSCDLTLSQHAKQKFEERLKELRSEK